jgi:hypothetical protein
MLRCIVFVTAAVAAAFALTASGATAAQRTAGLRAAAAAGHSVNVRFAINRFARQNNRLVASGEAVATYTSPDGRTETARKAFTATVRGRLPGRTPSAAERVCPVLFLQLDKLSLTLLGLNVDLDKVALTINADSNGGVLGDLFCKLVHARISVRSIAPTARRLTALAQQSGLTTTSALGFTVPISPAAATGATALSCPVLDLVLGPLTLRLLGVIANLNQVHLTIAADPVGGVLGTLFCGLVLPKPA